MVLGDKVRTKDGKYRDGTVIRVVSLEKVYVDWPSETPDPVPMCFEERISDLVKQ